MNNEQYGSGKSDEAADQTELKVNDTSYKGRDAKI